jgi:glyoxylate carboligase
MKMTTEEAFVKVLQMHGIEHAFGIIGSAMMPISDLFPQAGIQFWDCAHEGIRRHDGGWIHTRNWRNVHDDCAKRPRYHKLCDSL